MKIVIAGAGEVGSHLAKLLSNEEQDITLLDPDPEHLAMIDANYNLMTLTGNPTSFRSLREAHADECDLFIAVMPEETNNVMACAMAKSLGAACTVARIGSYDFMEPRNREFVLQMGVDRLIYPEYLAAQEIITALNRSWVRHWFELHNGEIIVVGVRLPGNARLTGMQLKEFASVNHNFHVSAIKRNHEIIIPRGDDRMEENDILYITATREHVAELPELTGKVQHRVRRVLMMGGGKIAIRVANMSPDNFRFRIIDNNMETCKQLPQKCPNCEIVYGDGRDTEVLNDAGIDDMDAFVALTSSSETNILACLTAKELGVKKTIAEVENMQFINQAEGLNIGTVINKKLLASSSIFQLLLDSDSSTSKCLALTDAEVAELEVKPGSKLTHALVKDLRLPREMTLAGLIRDGKGMLVTGNTQIMPGDHVVVFCLSGAIHKVERIFN